MEKSDLQKVILSVNNDPAKQDIIKMFLNRIDVVLIQAPSGKEALAVLRQEHVDLVLTALAMPEMSGLDLAKHLRNPEFYRQFRNSSPDLPIMAVSTTPLKKDKMLAYGIDDRLLIPVNREIFLERVTALLGDDHK